MENLAADPQDPHASVVDDVVDQQPVFSPTRAAENELALKSFVTDLAQRLYSYREIAQRYGFPSVLAMRDFLAAHPVIAAQIKEHRAIWESDDTIEVRIRKVSNLYLLDALPTLSRTMVDLSAKPTERNDTGKFIASLAGATQRGDGSALAPQSGKFSVNIVFSQAGKVETFSTVESPPEPETIEHEEAA